MNKNICYGATRVPFCLGTKVPRHSAGSVIGRYAFDNHTLGGISREENKKALKLDS